MDRDTIRDYLAKSDFGPMQADTLSHLLSQTVTKEDLHLAVKELEKSHLRLKAELEGSIQLLRHDVEGSTQSIRSELEDARKYFRTELDRFTRALGSEMKESTLSLKVELQQSIHRVEANMSRWMITILVALAGLITLLNYFLD